MAYGILTDQRNFSPYQNTFKRASNGFTRVNGPDAEMFTVLYKSREGSNATSVRSAKRRPVGTKLVPVYKVLPGAPRVAVKVTDPVTGKSYYKRERLKTLVTKRVPVYGKPRRGLDLPPNNLTYVERGNFLDTNHTVVKTTDGEYSFSGVNSIMHLNTSGHSWVGPDIINISGENYPPVVSNALPSIEAKAYQKLLEKLSNHKANLAVALAERKQTIKMIGDIVKRIASVIIAAKKGNFTGAFKTLFPTTSKKAANDYLMWHFGLQPALSDLDGAMKFLAERSGPFSFDVIAKHTEEVQGTGRSQDNGFSMSPRCTWSTECNTTVTVKYKVRVEITAPVMEKFKSLGLINSPLAFWEAIPFSFIIDWMLPIGNYLETLDALEGIRVVHAHKTVHIKSHYVCTKQYGGLDTSYWCEWEPLTTGSVHTKTYVNRTPLSRLPPPPIPEFQNPFSLSHVTTSLALLRQLKR